MKFAITICATKRYTYAMSAQARRVQAACQHIKEGHIILVGDGSDELKKIQELYKRLMPDEWKVYVIWEKSLVDNHKNYKENAQMVIGQMRTAAFDMARSLDIDQCLSLDSDVLPPANAVKAMQQMLEFDDGYYSIATCPYPSQGGGGFLGGRGTIFHPIAPDFYEEEREVPENLKNQLIEIRKKIADTPRPKSEEESKAVEALHKSCHELEEKAKACPPKGNVFELNGKRWRPRGWFDNAYPALGKGAVVPSDWCGFGCTMMNKKALAYAHFDGYDGRGTEDLYIVWHRWYTADLKLCCIAHCPCDHVIRNPGKEGYFILQQAYHETEGECVGHLRIRPRAFYAFDFGEKFDPENNGKFVPKKEESVADSKN